MLLRLSGTVDSFESRDEEAAAGVRIVYGQVLATVGVVAGDCGCETEEGASEEYLIRCIVHNLRLDVEIDGSERPVIEDSIVNPVPFTTVLMGLTMAHKTWMC